MGTYQREITKVTAKTVEPVVAVVPSTHTIHLYISCHSFQVQLLDGSRASHPPSTVSSSDGSSTVAVICEGRDMPSPFVFAPCSTRSGVKAASK